MMRITEVTMATAAESMTITEVTMATAAESVRMREVTTTTRQASATRVGQTAAVMVVMTATITMAKPRRKMMQMTATSPVYHQARKTLGKDYDAASGFSTHLLAVDFFSNLDA
jgi:outer membrane lipopolysaccharide assembly protein LptE/RlpB